MVPGAAVPALRCSPITAGPQRVRSGCGGRPVARSSAGAAFARGVVGGFPLCPRPCGLLWTHLWITLAASRRLGVCICIPVHMSRPHRPAPGPPSSPPVDNRCSEPGRGRPLRRPARRHAAACGGMRWRARPVRRRAAPVRPVWRCAQPVRWHAVAWGCARRRGHAIVCPRRAGASPGEDGGLRLRRPLPWWGPVPGRRWWSLAGVWGAPPERAEQIVRNPPWATFRSRPSDREADGSRTGRTVLHLRAGGGKRLPRPGM